MRLCAEISLYPLADDYLPAIRAFIQRLNGHPQLSVETSATSTRVAGQYDLLMTVLADEMRTTFAGAGRSVFVVKFLGGGEP